MKSWKTTVSGIVAIVLAVLHVLGVEIPFPDVAGHVVHNLDVAALSAGVGSIFARDNTK